MPEIVRDPIVGHHYWDGSCRPGKVRISTQETFSVGVFEMELRTSARARGASGPASMKRGKVKVRVIGWASNPKAVYDLADQICEQLDAGTYKGSKIRWV
jgi:hypothetical protein